jgi:hypothetical protein
MVRIVDRFDRELRFRGQSDGDPYQTVLQQQTVSVFVVFPAGGAICAIDCREERILTMRPVIHLLDSSGRDAESLGRLMTRKAGTAVCPLILKEGVLFVDVSVPSGVERSDGSGCVPEMLKVGNNDGSDSGKRDGKNCHTNKTGSPDASHNQASLRSGWCLQKSGHVWIPDHQAPNRTLGA